MIADFDYIKKRNKLINIAAKHADEITGKVKKQFPDLTAGEFNRREC